MKTINKKLLLESVKWFYGFSNKKAADYIKDIDKNCDSDSAFLLKQELINGYLKQCHIAFYCD